MRAATYAGAGGLDMLVVRDDVPDPEPGTDDVLVEVAYGGLNRADVLERAGNYPSPRQGARFTIGGMEFSGTVRATGSGVTHLATGDRVCGIVATAAHAELLVTNGFAVAKLPAAVDLRTAAAIPEAFITAHDALFDRGRFALGEIALVHAAGSSVGLAALSLAKRAGGITIGTSRTPDKLERARAYGLDTGVVLDERWRADVQRATGNRGADVILDFVGGAMLEANVGALASGGRIVQIGTMGGAQSQLHLGLLMAKRGALHGTVLRSRPPEQKIALAKHLERDLLPLFARGELTVPIDRSVPLADIGAAHEAMERNENFGKIVIAIGSGAAN